MLKSTEGLKIIDSKIITQVEEVMSVDCNMVIAHHEYNQLITPEEIVANFSPFTDWGIVCQFIKGNMEVEGQTLPFTSDPSPDFKIFPDAHILTPTEIRREKGIAEWMTDTGIYNVVRTRRGIITQFEEGDQIIFSQKPENALINNTL